jgi:hypothetical protein
VSIARQTTRRPAGGLLWPDFLSLGLVQHIAVPVILSRIGRDTLRISTYPFEKFFNAVTSMATSDEPLPNRLASACRSLAGVRHADFKTAESLNEFKKLVGGC